MPIKRNLSYDALKKFHNWINCEQYRVTCFFDGKQWICPDPKDKKRVDSITKDYDNGYYFFDEDICVTKDNLKNVRTFD